LAPTLAEHIGVYRRGGFQAVLEWRLAGFNERAAKKYVAPMVFAFANAQLKRKEETLRYLEESYQQRSPELVFVQNDPNYDFVHSDPRYRAIIKTMGLPRAY
jgi:hypothetical protein